MLGDGSILDSLTLQRLVLLLNLLHDFFKLLDALRVSLFFLLLGLVLGVELELEALVELVIGCLEVFLGLAECLELSIHELLLLGPLLPGERRALLLVL